MPCLLLLCPPLLAIIFRCPPLLPPLCRHVWPRRFKPPESPRTARLLFVCRPTLLPWAIVPPDPHCATSSTILPPSGIPRRLSPSTPPPLPAAKRLRLAGGRVPSRKASARRHVSTKVRCCPAESPPTPFLLAFTRWGSPPPRAVSDCHHPSTSRIDQSRHRVIPRSCTRDSRRRLRAWCSFRGHHH